ncbi:MAG: tRNA pseudouridine(55) synthase TruB [Anaerolineae bacterium]|nr:tRNA pseudouridine(55) synthase TruB [Anaerolineae bacterium]
MVRVASLREPCLVCSGGDERAVRWDVGLENGPISGILNLDKPSGLTSHDVVDRIRLASGLRRVGHAGTLDPAALGVLLLCLGQATRVSGYLMEGRKRYDALITLGVATDTGDAEGRVLSTSMATTTTREQVLATLRRFRGRVEQVPPMYSALKHEGKPLYSFARRGLEVARAPREVEIYALELVEWTPPSFRVLVECSKGTYIRALARDLGEELGTGAHLDRLARLACGSYTLDEATSIADAERSLSSGQWRQIVHPLDEALLCFEAFRVDEESEQRIRHGQQVEGPPPLDGSLCRAYGPSGRLIGLLQYDEHEELWQPRKVFQTHGATD